MLVTRHLSIERGLRGLPFWKARLHSVERVAVQEESATLVLDLRRIRWPRCRGRPVLLDLIAPAV
jgi:hypothetical protein